MVQYYRIVNLTKKQYFNPIGNKKIGEFSYLGNKTMAFLYNLLQEVWKGDKVVVVGSDYVKEQYNSNLDYNDSHLYAVEYDELFTEVKPSHFKFKLLNTFKSHKKGFYINETTKEFIDMSKLPKVNGNVVSPLALMIALGNNPQNDEDYTGINDFIVGRWAWNKVRIELEIKEKSTIRKLGFKEISPNFSEV